MVVEDEYFNSLVSKVWFNLESERLEHDDDLSRSLYISGNEVDSLCEFAEDSLLMTLKNLNLMLISEKWIITHEMKIDGICSLSDKSLLPGFSLQKYPFLLIPGPKNYDLVNVLNGWRDTFILGSTWDGGCDYR